MSGIDSLAATLLVVSALSAVCITLLAAWLVDRWQVRRIKRRK